MDDECRYGHSPSWCETCNGTDLTLDDGYDYGRETKQDLLNQLCDPIGLPVSQRVREAACLHASSATPPRRLASQPGPSRESTSEVAVTAGLKWELTAALDRSQVAVPSTLQMVSASCLKP